VVTSASHWEVHVVTRPARVVTGEYMRKLMLVTGEYMW